MQGRGLCLVDVVAELGAAGEVHDLHDIGVDDVDCRHTVASQSFGHDRFEASRTHVDDPSPVQGELR